MALGWRAVLTAGVFGVLLPAMADAARKPSAADAVAPDYDVRLLRPGAARPLDARAAAAVERLQAERPAAALRMDRRGRLRALAARLPDVEPGTGESAIDRVRAFVQSHHEVLGLDADGASTLVLSHHLESPRDPLVHLTFSQRIDGLPVFGSALRAHLSPDGGVVHLSSTLAASGDLDPGDPALSATDGLRAALRALQADTSIAAGRLKAASSVDLVLFDTGARLRRAWHAVVEPDGLPRKYDVLVDATTGELLYRRNRVLYAEGTGRIYQSDATRAFDPRHADPHPAGAAASGAGDPPLGCPPVANHLVRDLVSPFRDAPTVLSNSGWLAGNNGRVDRGASGFPGVAGTAQGDGSWSFDGAPGSADASETQLFFLLNALHDVFYDLGFDEAAGNFQTDNFGRGGLAGDGLVVVSRAAGRNNATFEPMPDGQPPVMSFFLWDGAGCWAEDVDADGETDLDSGLDADVVIHEFHHGVSTRLNPVFTGAEADAIGEGGSDFFAYSLNGDTTLAEYSLPPYGIRQVNGRTYGSWTCLFDIVCEPHDNGEIWANVLWDLRERFRGDSVDGTPDTGIYAAHLLYVDGLKLSPPSPTMLDLRDAMLLADVLRRSSGDPGGSVNYCRIWEVFALRGMGVLARDTTDTASLTVVQDFSVPPACPAPPAPATVTLTASDATASEAGQEPAVVTVRRSGDTTRPLTVYLNPATGSAIEGRDFFVLPAMVVIPADATTAGLSLVPVDDALVENAEVVTISLAPGPGYRPVSPASTTLTIVSDDIAPDLVVSLLTGPATSGPGATLTVSETTRNAGTDAADASITRFLLSTNTTLEADDIVLGARPVPALAVGATSTELVTLTLPADTPTGTYYLLALADADQAVAESSEINNVRGLVIRVGPDLTVSSLAVPSPAAAGTSIVVTTTTRNAGGGSSAASTTTLYLSTNGSFDAGDTVLGSQSVPVLAAGTSFTAATTVDLAPGTAAGSYYVIARADAATVVAELVESNNTAVATLRLGPDLAVSVLTAPPVTGGGALLTITDTTRNQGGAGTTPSVTRFFLSTDAIATAGDVVLGSRAVGVLDPGATAAAATTVTVPVDTAVGTYYLLAVADADDTNVETMETNNVARVSIRVGPDLDVTAATAPGSGEAGANLSIVDTIKNVGGGMAGASTATFYFSTNATVDPADPPIGTRSVPALAAGATSTAATVVAVPPGTTAGTYYVIVLADASGTVAETSETNNAAALLVRVGPDLTVTTLTTATSVTGAGLPLAVTVTTKNAGAGSAPPSTTRFYLSANTTVDAGDVPVGSRSIAGLAGGAVDSSTSLITIPPATDTGAYYVVAVADADGSVLETSETNNVRAVAIRVGPDLRTRNFTGPSSTTVDRAILVTDTVRNEGGGNAAATTTRFYLSTNGVLDAGDVLLGSRATPALAPGGSSTASTSLPLPLDTTPQRYYLLAVADADGAVVETFENNNVAWVLVTVGAAVLDVTP